MGVNDCVFCKIISGKIPCMKICENEKVLAFLDIGPVSDGHTLVIPKGHYGKLHECPEEVLVELSNCLGKIAPTVAGAMETEAYNILCNNGRAAGQLVEHVHFHIIPRRDGDGVFSHWPAYEYEHGRADAIVKKICEKL
jgi:histidine triad (HIT) family protein